MPAVVTYNSLVADMKNYQQRGSSQDTRYIDQIPRLIAKAEFRLAADAKTLINRTPITGALTTGSPVLDKPAFWRNTISLTMGTGAGFNTLVPLYLRDIEYIRFAYPLLTSTSQPKYYADYDMEHWYIGPIPNNDYPIETIVDMRVTPLDATNQTNFYTVYVPNLLVDACMFEASIFLKNWGEVPMREKTYQGSLGGALKEQAQRITDRTQESRI